MDTGTNTVRDLGALAAMLMCVSGIIVIVGIVASQSDYVSRKYLLTPKRLSHKRLREQLYSWQIQLTACLSMIRQMELNHGLYLEHTLEVFEKLSTDNLLDEFVNEYLLESTGSGEQRMMKEVTILGVSKDEKEISQDWFIFILVKEGNSHRRVQLPLVPFGTRLADALEKQDPSSASTTFCFIADASSSQSSEVLMPILSSTMGMKIWREPVWIAMMAYIFQQRLYAISDLDKTFSALLRLLARVDSNHAIPYQTIVVLLPGQATTVSLLPSLVRCFPDDRHVFCYSNLIDSLSYSLRTYKADTTAQNCFTMPSQFSANTPLDSSNALLRKIPNLDANLANLNLKQASIIQAWISSVDTCLTLKDKSNDKYLPFVSRLPFLDPNSVTNTTIEKETNKPLYYLALSSLLQYITGTTSQPLSDDLLSKTADQLKTVFPTISGTLITPELRKIAEACVLCHKGILIENKILLDTVLPRKDWSLKTDRN